MIPFAAIAIAAAALTDPAAAPPPAAPAATPATTAPRRYCLVQEFTGSRIARKECRTLADWKAIGVDTSDWTSR